MMLYQCRQNNSGGYFTGPAIYVLVEAPQGTNHDDLVELFERAGVDFDADFCECCGERWYTPWGGKWETVDPDSPRGGKVGDRPIPLLPLLPVGHTCRTKGVPGYCILWADGRIEVGD